jgi:uncharacterized alpha-E superfamily protein
MLSRVADSLYWMSRYLERAEHTARVINVQLDLMLEMGSESDDSVWSRTRRALGIEKGDIPEGMQMTDALISNPQSRASIVTCINLARENARQVREQISSEMWEQLNMLFLEVKRTGRGQIKDMRDFLEAIKQGSHLFQGITDATMTHGEGWQFIQVGRYLERAGLVSALVDVHFREFDSLEVPVTEHLEWIGLLKSCTAFEAYCKAYTADLQPVRIAEFLLLHAQFPHSIRFSADALEKALKEIGSEVSERRSSRVERIAGKMRATLGFGQIDEILAGGLNAYLDTVRRQCAQVHGALYQTYVTYPIEAALGA